MGFKVDNTMFKEYSQYFRNALVRANYADYSRGIGETLEFIEKFYRNLLTKEIVPLKNRELILMELFDGIEK